MKLKKNKIWILGLGAGLMATTGIVTPLIVSCSSNDPSKPQDTDGNDKKYNITQATYDNLEKQFIFKYQHKKMAEGLLGDKLSADMTSLKNILSSLRKETNKVNYNFTMRTNSMIELANDKYDIQLSRGFSSSLDNDFAQQHQIYSNMFSRYLKNHGFSPQQSRVFTNTFSNNFSGLKQKMLSNFSDPLFALTQLKANMASCFGDATRELEYVHTQQLFTEFFKTNNFIYNQTTCLDELAKQVGFEEGKDITKFIPCFLTYTIKNKPSTLGKDWATTLIPSHIIKPILKKIKFEKFSNVNVVLVDWTLMNIKYLSPEYTDEDRELATAHYVSPNDCDSIKNVKSLDEYIKVSDKTKNFKIYQMSVSKEKEKQTIKRDYGSLKFSFTNDRKNQAYEVFMPCVNKPDGAKLTSARISTSGLMLWEPGDNSPVLYKDIIKKLKALTNEQREKMDPIEDYSIKEKFVFFTDFYSIFKITNDNLHAVEGDIYASYKNSPYVSDEQAIKINPDNEPIKAQGLVYSDNFYNDAKCYYDQARKYYDSIVEADSISPVILLGVFLVLQVIFLVITIIDVGKIILEELINPLGNKIYGVISLIFASITAISIIALIAELSIMLKIATEDLFACKDFMKKQSFIDYKKIILDNEQLYWNREVFNKTKLEDLQPSYIFFSQLKDQPLYQQLLADAKESHIDKGAFEQNILKAFNITCIVSTIMFVIELLVWGQYALINGNAEQNVENNAKAVAEKKAVAKAEQNLEKNADSRVAQNAISKKQEERLWNFYPTKEGYNAADPNSIGPTAIDYYINRSRKLINK